MVPDPGPAERLSGENPHEATGIKALRHPLAAPGGDQISGTRRFIERWFVRLIAWFLAPSRANSDVRRKRTRLIVTDVRRDECPGSQGSKGQGPGGQ